MWQAVWPDYLSTLGLLLQRKFAQWHSIFAKVFWKFYQIVNKSSKNCPRLKIFPKWRNFNKYGNTGGKGQCLHKIHTKTECFIMNCWEDFCQHYQASFTVELFLLGSHYFVQFVVKMITYSFYSDSLYSGEREISCVIVVNSPKRMIVVLLTRDVCFSITTKSHTSHHTYAQKLQCLGAQVGRVVVGED